MSNIKLVFEYAYLLPLLIPTIILAFIPFLKLPKHRRHSNGRVLSLILHCIILTLTTLVLAGCRIHIENAIKTKDVLFLVDQSYSLKSEEDDIDVYLAKILNEYNSEYRVGIINFARDYDYVAHLSTDAKGVLRTYLANKDKVDMSGTDFAKALYYAKSLFKNPKNGRIIVISDGLQTDEDGLLACKNLTGDGVVVDCVYMENQKWSSDAIISNVQFFEEPSLNTPNKLIIEIQNYNLHQAQLIITDNNQIIYNQNISLIQENELYEIPITFTSTKLHEVKVSLNTTDDTLTANNQYYVYANILGVEQILIVEGVSGVGEPIKNLLLDFSYECQVTTTEDIENHNLDDYGQVILANVNNDDLPTGYDSVIEEYVKTGGNLFTTGGENTYNLGEMKDTKFDDFMPITFEAPDYKPQVFMFVMDNSSSMKETIGGSSKTKMDLAKEAAIAAVNSLHTYDYVGVITFAKSAVYACEIMPVSRKTEIIDKIEAITTSLGTNYLPALKLANDKLVGFTETENKNVLFLSDGNPQDDQYKAYVASMYGKKITTSVITLGDNINESEMEELASIGGGTYYHVSGAAQLVSTMIEAMTSFSKEDFVKETIVPLIARHGSLVSGIRTLPELKGYNRIAAKANSETYLSANDNPIYVRWNYFDGKVGCFMGDLSTVNAPLYFTNEQGALFIRNVVNSMSTTTASQREMNVTIVDDNYFKRVEVRTPSSGGNNTVSGKLTYPDKSTKTIELVMSANNTYTITLSDLETPGIYSLELTKNSSGKKTTQMEYFTFSFSKEYIYQSQGIDFLNELSKVSNHGKLYQLDEPLFTNEIEYDIYEFNPQITFLIIALVLFLFDIMVRKFKFEWLLKKNNATIKQSS